ncbi:pentapeptide repeat-containing protein [Nostoc sp. KVJ3]|uniref:pentapeptide repeat-containing protein n=1 Tax=Nostoc sp. KVJ3 TaxID=457945 RepID=UPI002238C665|nr:pentapeptide repeat-containing protein [Nostoc sp. KVJ3]
MSITQCKRPKTLISRERIQPINQDLSISTTQRLLQPASQRWLIKPAYDCYDITTCRYNLCSEATTPYRSKSMEITAEELRRRCAAGEKDFGGIIVREGEILDGINLRGVNLRGASFHSVSLVGADLSHALLSGAYLSEAVLDGADLHGADLHGTGFWKASLRNCNLCRAQLNGADLGVTNCRGANLSEADLRGARMDNTRLKGANLSHADLRGAEDVYLEGAILHKTIMPDGSIQSS